MKSSVEPMIHCFKQNGMNIVMDVNSAILHVVDDMTYDVLADYNGTNREAVHNVWMGLIRPASSMKTWMKLMN